MLDAIVISPEDPPEDEAPQDGRYDIDAALAENLAVSATAYGASPERIAKAFPEFGEALKHGTNRKWI